MSQLGFDIARDYGLGQLNGWHGPEAARAAYEALRRTANFLPFRLSGQSRATAGRKMMLYDVCRKVLGKDTPNYAQQIGDCVSFGAKNAAEYVTCTQILLGHMREKWRPVFPPYYYGTGRVQIGGQHDYEDGSTGAWMAAAVMKYGTLFADEQGVPAYDKNVAKQWGHDGPPKNFLDVGQKYLIKSASLLNSWDDLVASVVNGYPCPVASNVGYSMEAGSDGFHVQNAQWGHQMCFIGVDETYKNGSEPYAIILNNWGDVHGHLKDFDNGEDLPVGVLRVRRRDAEKHIQAGETFAYSQFDGFPEQQLDEALFKIFGT